MRAMHLLPKRGDKPEWQHTQDYWREKDTLPAIDLENPAFVYEGFEPRQNERLWRSSRPI